MSFRSSASLGFSENFGIRGAENQDFSYPVPFCIGNPVIMGSPGKFRNFSKRSALKSLRTGKNGREQSISTSDSVPTHIMDSLNSQKCIVHEKIVVSRQLESEVLGKFRNSPVLKIKLLASQSKFL